VSNIEQSAMLLFFMGSGGGSPKLSISEKQSLIYRQLTQIKPLHALSFD
jgi:hypothetical protein